VHGIAHRSLSKGYTKPAAIARARVNIGAKIEIRRDLSHRILHNVGEICVCRAFADQSVKSDTHGTIAEPAEPERNIDAFAVLIERKLGGRRGVSEIALARADLVKADAYASARPYRKPQLFDAASRLERSRHRTEEEFECGDCGRAGLRLHDDLGPQRHGDQSNLGGGIGVRDGPADRTAIARRLMSDPGKRPGQEWNIGGDERRFLRFDLSGRGTDNDRSIRPRDAGKFRQA
jgi:hypothetical protein